MQPASPSSFVPAFRRRRGPLLAEKAADMDEKRDLHAANFSAEIQLGQTAW